MSAFIIAERCVRCVLQIDDLLLLQNTQKTLSLSRMLFSRKNHFHRFLLHRRIRLANGYAAISLFAIAVCVYTAKHVVGLSLTDYCCFLFAIFDSRVIAQTTARPSNELTRKINHIAIEQQKTSSRYVLISSEPNGKQTPLRLINCLYILCVWSDFQFGDSKKNCLFCSFPVQSFIR